MYVCALHIKRIDQFSPFGDGVPQLRMVRVRDCFGRLELFVLQSIT